MIGLVEHKAGLTGNIVSEIILSILLLIFSYQSLLQPQEYKWLSDSDKEEDQPKLSWLCLILSLGSSLSTIGLSLPWLNLPLLTLFSQVDCNDPILFCLSFRHRQT